MRRWLSKLDEHAEGLDSALVNAVALMRSDADNPEAVEGELRHGLRQAANLVEQLRASQQTLIAFNRRASIRFAVLSASFVLLFVVNFINWLTH